jgi:hypothetical protein
MPLPAGITQDQVNEVRAALESDKWDWRTVHGVAKDTKLDEKIVRKIIRHLIKKGDVIQSEIDSDDGDELYTTRSHYENSATLWDRMKAAFRNRAE